MHVLGFVLYFFVCYVCISLFDLFVFLCLIYSIFKVCSVAGPLGTGWSFSRGDNSPPLHCQLLPVLQPNHAFSWTPFLNLNKPIFLSYKSKTGLSLIHTWKNEGSGNIIPANFLDFPPNFRLRTRF